MWSLGCGLFQKGRKSFGWSDQVRSTTYLWLRPCPLNLPSNRYLVYNLRKRGGDSADKYFKFTELVTGVKDMQFQALMPDVLHWLGIKKIDNMVSMSDMKYNAIMGSEIPILKWHTWYVQFSPFLTGQYIYSLLGAEFLILPGSKGVDKKKEKKT